MKLIIGLGNPGKQYEKTRHNAGFILLDEMRKIFCFPEFQENKKFKSLLTDGLHHDEKIILAKPETFMNHSGQAVQEIMNFYKISIEDLIVIHDDLDIELGEFKISTDSSAAGHNGVRSIFDTFGTQKIKRFRIGIEGAAKKKDRTIPGDVFVLQDFSAEELKTTSNLSEKISRIL